ncbi:DUF4350 domain-containing protein [Methanogenium sp. MK-MG]|uniref:DUF4350 domain-containing protein n=1 Tax=Methanogenium sp. MK-MG TaxID=2599926 RepID=UPI0013ED54F7|nr:DUF4350 domain-containing protein [Methanogenium sp. MK-MG]KAF1078611.1 hypothetical protein MKMG_00465 [Methanogenium sp. MK-MG]
MKQTTGNILVVAALILAGIVILSYLSSTDAELSRYNGGWNGTSAFYDQLDRTGSTAITSYAILRSAPPETLIMVEPHALPEEETDSIRQFVRDGGTLIVIAKNESANSILEAMGSSIRIHESILSSIDREYADPRMVIAYRAQDHRLLKGVESIALNQPSTLTGGEILLQTSVISWIDRNNNGRADGMETFGKETVMAREFLESGEIIILSDSGVLINSMDTTVSERDNTRLRNNLATGMDTAYDTIASQPFETDGALQAVTGAKNTTIIKILVLLLITGIICAAYARRIL